MARILVSCVWGMEGLARAPAAGDRPQAFEFSLAGAVELAFAQTFGKHLSTLAGLVLDLFVVAGKELACGGAKDGFAGKGRLKSRMSGVVLVPRYLCAIVTTQ